MTKASKRLCGTSVLALITATTMMASTSARAQTSGGIVVAGQAQIDGQGTSQTIVTQTSDRAIVNWDAFSLGKGDSAIFRQPGNQSITVNRVTGQNPSAILGSIQANGQVVLINRNGILFGKDSTVDASGLIATTHDIDAGSFMAGARDLRFVDGGDDQAEVVVQGRITIRDAGIAAFVAPHVRNDGLIVAKMGRVALGAGKGFGIDLYGDGLISFAPDAALTKTVTDASGQTVAALVENAGTIEAQGGRILLTASAARDVVNASVNVGGLLRADSATGQGGVITLGGSGAVITQTESAITVAGAQGGSVSVSGGEVGIGGLIDASSSGLRATGGAVSVAATGSLSLAGTTRAASAYGAGGTLSYSGGGVIENSESRSDASGLIGGGTIRLTADGTVMTSGQYRADGGYAGGGRIDLTAPDIRTLGATLSATGRQQGGLVRIGGAFQGGKTPDASQPYFDSFAGRWGDVPVLASAQKVLVNDSTAIDVSSTHGAGGTAVVWSDVQTTFLGAVDARGGAGAQGGSVELSSAGDLRQAALGGVQTGGGNLLLDPKNIVIGDSSDISGWVYQGLVGYGYTGSKDYNTGGTLDSNGSFGKSVALNATGNLLAAAADKKIILIKFSDGNFSGASLKGYIAKSASGSNNLALGDDLQAENLLGSGMSMNADGDRLVFSDTSDNSKGAVFLVKFTDTSFSNASLAGKIGYGYYTRPSDFNMGTLIKDRDYFGAGVSLSGDGLTLAIGAPYDASQMGGNVSGAVYIISFSDRNFNSPSLKLRLGYGYTDTKDYNTGGESGTGSFYGSSVALNRDGTSLAVGATNLSDAVGSSARGGVLLYKVFNGGGSVSYKGTVGYGFSTGSSVNIGNDNQYASSFGRAVSFNSAGDRLAIGGSDSSASGGRFSYGAAYIVKFSDMNFSGGSIATIGRGYTGGNNYDLSSLWPNDNFAASVALSGSGNRLVVGAPGDDGSGTIKPGAGAVYLFSAIGPSVTGQTYSTSSSATVKLAASDIVSQLAAGTSVTLEASNDITVSSPIKVTGNPSRVGDLNLQAGRSILIGSDIQTQGGRIYLYANQPSAGGVIDAQRDSGNAVISMAPGTTIEAGSGSVNFVMGNGGSRAYSGNGDISLYRVYGASIVATNRGTTADTGVVLNAGGGLTATGVGTAINLAGKKFTNSAGSGALSAANGYWRVWTADPDADTVGGLDYAFKQYGLSYGAALSRTGNALIYSRAPVVGATLSGYSKVYDRTTDAPGTVPVATNVVGSDIVRLTGTVTFADKNVGTNKQISGAATGIASATTSDGKPIYGYTLSSTDRNFTVSDGTITAAALTLTGAAVTTRAYDRTDTASVTGTLNGVFSGDTVTLQSLTGTFNNRNVGTNKSVTLSGYTLAGTDAGNYTLTLPTGLTGAITRATLAVTGVTATNKVYDGGLTATISGGTVTPFSGDTVTLDRSAVTAAFGTKAVGTGKLVMVNGFAISGTVAA
ncbi:beta strand repeat-containing protein [Sphingomonas floccifaciens]|uniref:Beta strand repeat-containing protein n=1 Tax=Sphingomonas floccifaciens TaxID=1844115 RepID=A0ABW4NCR6_9SPHN